LTKTVFIATINSGKNQEAKIMKEHCKVHAGVFVRTPEKMTSLVFDGSKRGPEWKLPGGGEEYLPLLHRWETPEETARRELFEETGLTAKELRLIMVISKGTHMWYLFEATLPNLDGLLPRGNDGEYVAKFPEPQLLNMPNFLTPHKEVLRDLVRKGVIQL